MQNRYVGDVGDFGKHGLLRFLSGRTAGDDLDRLRLGLVWYMHHDERHGVNKRVINRDGKNTGYLNATEQNARDFGDCDRDLWFMLGHLVGQDARCVHCVESVGILPEDTLYYDAQLYYVPGISRQMKEDTRGHWFRKALASTCAADLVCVDPDNGITRDTKMYQPNGPKFVYMSDLLGFWNRGQSLVVYHQLDHSAPAWEQVRAKAETIRGGLLGAEPIPLLFHRGTARVFYVMPQPERKEIIKARVSRMLDTAWSNHFEWVG